MVLKISIEVISNLNQFAVLNNFIVYNFTRNNQQLRYHVGVHIGLIILIRLDHAVRVRASVVRSSVYFAAP